MHDTGRDPVCDNIVHSVALYYSYELQFSFISQS